MGNTLFRFVMQVASLATSIRGRIGEIPPSVLSVFQFDRGETVFVDARARFEHGICP